MTGSEGAPSRGAGRRAQAASRPVLLHPRQRRHCMAALRRRRRSLRLCPHPSPSATSSRNTPSGAPKYAAQPCHLSQTVFDSQIAATWRHGPRGMSSPCSVPRQEQGHPQLFQRFPGRLSPGCWVWDRRHRCSRAVLPTTDAKLQNGSCIALLFGCV